MSKLEGTYNPKDFEEELYQEWEQKGYFKQSLDKTKEPQMITAKSAAVKKEYSIDHFKPLFRSVVYRAFQIYHQAI